MPRRCKILSKLKQPFGMFLSQPSAGNALIELFSNQTINIEHNNI